MIVDLRLPLSDAVAEFEKQVILYAGTASLA
jgi:hypothetical protein